MKEKGITKQQIVCVVLMNIISILLGMFAFNVGNIRGKLTKGNIVLASTGAPVTTYTITYKDNNGVVLSTEEVAEGQAPKGLNGNYSYIIDSGFSICEKQQSEFIYEEVIDKAIVLFWIYDAYGLATNYNEFASIYMSGNNNDFYFIGFAQELFAPMYIINIPYSTITINNGQEDLSIFYDKESYQILKPITKIEVDGGNLLYADKQTVEDISALKLARDFTIIATNNEPVTPPIDQPGEQKPVEENNTIIEKISAWFVNFGNQIKAFFNEDIPNFFVNIWEQIKGFFTIRI